MEVVRNWRLSHERLQLVGEVCHNVGCGKKIMPKRDICPHCNQPANVEYKFSGKGEVYSFTTVYEPPAGFEENVPYVVALIKLEEGPLITAQLTDLEMEWGPEEIDGEIRQVGKYKVDFGMPVEMVTRVLKKDGDRGLITYGYKFRPVLREAPSEEVVVFKAQEAEVPASY